MFEDADYVYLVMELGNGGELLEDFHRTGSSELPTLHGGRRRLCTRRRKQQTSRSKS